jgi:outer membrane protein insertion porin family
LFPNPSYAPVEAPALDPTLPLEVQVEETQTGRFMVGVGVNSEAGVVGSVVVDEQNFDISRFPRGFEDFRNGTAFRGAGQRFRLELLPGSEVQRYLVNFQEPYLWDTPISLGLSGFYYDRRFEDWDEERLGGRVSGGYQLTPDLSATLAYRGENVNVHDPRTPTPPELAEVVGDNALHGFKFTLAHDTRDSAFLPTQGHYIETGFEQVVGSFDYPRATGDFRKYFLMRERPDGSGRHVLSVGTRLGFSGSNTPIYDNFFAGGFSTLRGYDFRGASPRSMGVTVGGQFMWLNSVEYLLPVTADDMLRAVAFCDFGTVEPEVEINDFRVAPGIGLRITVPALGPAPIALDFAFPINSAPEDDEQIFSFSIGLLR